MARVTAGPNEYLVVGRGGKLTNLGTAVKKYLPPGSVHVLVPSTKQEATFELTHESKDGIPLRFKGIVIYRIVDPVTAAQQFDFTPPPKRPASQKGAPAKIATGAERISQLLSFICMGELRSVVSDMTMQECIQQRKTTLTRVVREALQKAVGGKTDSGRMPTSRWGIQLEVVQVAQVFIVDEELRRQMEAEVRDEIRVNSEKSNIQSDEEIQLRKILSKQRLEQKRLETEKENISRKESLELERLAYERRMQAEALETHRQKMELERKKVEAEIPVRKFTAEKTREALQEEWKTHQLAKRVKALEVEEELMLAAAKQRLQAEILPLEQRPELVRAASQIFQGSNLSIYGENEQLLALLAPLADLLARTLAPLVKPAAEPETPKKPDKQGQGKSTGNTGHL